MKKSFAAKTMALFLALLMAFGVLASADGVTTIEHEITVRCNEYFNLREVMEGFGVTVDTPPTGYSFYAQGAVTNQIYNWSGNNHEWGDLYGKEVGEGQINLNVYGNPPDYENYTAYKIKVNVVGSPNAVHAVTVQAMDVFSLDWLLEGTGYTGADVDAILHTLYSDSIQPYPNADGPVTQLYGNQRGKSFLFFLMNDGETVNFEINVEYTTLQWFYVIFLGGALWMKETDPNSSLIDYLRDPAVWSSLGMALPLIPVSLLLAVAAPAFFWALPLVGVAVPLFGIFDFLLYLMGL